MQASATAGNGAKPTVAWITHFVFAPDEYYQIDFAAYKVQYTQVRQSKGGHRGLWRALILHAGISAWLRGCMAGVWVLPGSDEEKSRNTCKSPNAGPNSKPLLHAARTPFHRRNLQPAAPPPSPCIAGETMLASHLAPDPAVWFTYRPFLLMQDAGAQMVSEAAVAGIKGATVDGFSNTTYDFAWNGGCSQPLPPCPFVSALPLTEGLWHQPDLCRLVCVTL